LNFFYLIILFIVLSFKTVFAFSEKGVPSAALQGRALQQGSVLPTAEVPQVMQGVSIQENLGKMLDSDLVFTDENNQRVTLAQMFSSKKPLILTLNYYRCTTLCSLQLVNLAQTLKDMNWQIGKDFHVATVSFDPTDIPQDAKKKQIEYLNMTNQPQGDWKFYVGDQENIKKLTEQIGFYFKYDPQSKEFAHAAAIFFITPDKKISSYLYGIKFNPRDVKFSLMDAAKNKIGSPTDQILLTCFHYNPTTGTYDALAVGILKIAAAVTVLFLLFVLGYFFWREKRKKAY
jgi:protein SCO1/2